MADTGVLRRGAQVTRKAGAGASATALAEAYLNDVILQAEGKIKLCSVRPSRHICYSLRPKRLEPRDC